MTEELKEKIHYLFTKMDNNLSMMSQAFLELDEFEILSGLAQIKSDIIKIEELYAHQIER